MRRAQHAVLALALIAAGCATAPAAKPAAAAPVRPSPAAAPAPAAGPAPAAQAATAPAAPAATADEAPASTCAGTLSGAAAGSFACTVSAHVAGEAVAFSVVPEGPVAGVATLAPATFTLAAPLRTASYGRDALLGGEALVITAAGERFVASGRRGEIALAIREAQRYGQGTGRTFYVVSGTLRARLTADRPGGGEVVVDVKF